MMKSNNLLNVYPGNWVHIILLVSAFLTSGCDNGGTVEHDSTPDLRQWFEIDTIVYLGGDEADIDDIKRFTVIAEDDSQLLIYVPVLRTSDSIFGLEQIDKGRGTRDTLQLAIPVEAREYFFVRDICVDAETIAILLHSQLLVYRVPSNQFVATAEPLAPIETVELERTYYEARLFNNRLLLLGCQVNGSNQIGELTGFQTYMVDNDSLSPIRLLPNPTGIGFTLFAPRHVIDASSAHIAVADLDRYRIMMYDWNGDSIGVVHREPEGWTSAASLGYKEIDLEYLSSFGPRGSKTLRTAMNELRPFAYKMSSIRLLHFLDDTTMMVAYATGKEHTKGMIKGAPEVHYDIWTLKDNTWMLVSRDLVDWSPNLDDTLSVSNMLPLNYGYMRIGNVNARLYTVEMMNPPSNPNMTYKELSDVVQRDILESDENPYSLVFYKIKRDAQY